MSPIYYYFPIITSDQKCVPSSTPNQYYCFMNFQNTNQGYRPTSRATFIYNGSDLYNVRTEYNNLGYDLTSYSTYVTAIEVHPELGRFWFPLFSIVCVLCIFYFVYRILFRRFIK